MKILVEVEIDTTTGNYSVKFNNLTTPGQDIDVNVASRMVKRVMDNVVVEKDKPKDDGFTAPGDTKTLN